MIYKVYVPEEIQKILGFELPKGQNFVGYYGDLYDLQSNWPEHPVYGIPSMEEVRMGDNISPSIKYIMSGSKGIIVKVTDTFEVEETAETAVYEKEEIWEVSLSYVNGDQVIELISKIY